MDEMVPGDELGSEGSVEGPGALPAGDGRLFDNAPGPSMERDAAGVDVASAGGGTSAAPCASCPARAEATAPSRAGSWARAAAARAPGSVSGAEAAADPPRERGAVGVCVSPGDREDGGDGAAGLFARAGERWASCCLVGDRRGDCARARPVRIVRSEFVGASMGCPGPRSMSSTVKMSAEAKWVLQPGGRGHACAGC